MPEKKYSEYHIETLLRISYKSNRARLFKCRRECHYVGRAKPTFNVFESLSCKFPGKTANKGKQRLPKVQVKIRKLLCLLTFLVKVLA